MNRKFKKRFLSLLPPLPRRGLLFTVIIFVLVILLLTYKNHDANNEINNLNELSPSTAKFSPTRSQASESTPPISASFTSHPLDNIDWDTTHWKTYNGYSSGNNKDTAFSIKYPPTWQFNKEDLGGMYYPFGKSEDGLNSPSIRLGTGGHGAPPQPYTLRVFPAGEALYGWQVINNKAYGAAAFRSGDKQYLFEVHFIPVNNPKEADTLKKIFDTMLVTFREIPNNWILHNELDFSFTYPAGNWEIAQGSQPAGKYIELKCGLNKCNHNNFISLTIEQLIYKSLIEYKESGVYKFFSQVRDTTLAGEPAIEGVIPGIHGGGFCCSSHIYFVVHNGKGYQITYDYPTLNLATFSQFPPPEPNILSTFQFTD